MTIKGSRSVPFSTTINGREYSFSIPSKYTLAELLREKLNLTGTKLGCNRAECGVCTVLVDGVPVFSCTVLAAEAKGREIETIEGLTHKVLGAALQKEFVKDDALQCGFCTPGILLSLSALFQKNSEPSVDEVKNSIAGNYCRCGAYPNIIEAAIRASRASKLG